MTEAQLKEIDDARRKREEELLLFLLLILGGAATQAFAATDEDPAAVIRRILLANAVNEVAETMADAHLDGFGVYAVSLGRAPSKATLIRQYEATARVAVDAMSDTIEDGIKLMGGDVLAGLVASGYSRTKSTGIELGAERNVVTASNAGIVDGFVVKTGGELTGFRHVSVIDDRTTAICTERDGLQLPVEHPYWENGWPSLHFRCRSVIQPLAGKFGVSERLPTVPPAVGFGKPPATVLALIRRRSSAA